MAQTQRTFEHNT